MRKILPLLVIGIVACTDSPVQPEVELATPQFSHTMNWSYLQQLLSDAETRTWNTYVTVINARNGLIEYAGGPIFDQQLYDDYLATILTLDNAAYRLGDAINAAALQQEGNVLYILGNSNDGVLKLFEGAFTNMLWHAERWRVGWAGAFPLPHGNNPTASNQAMDARNEIIDGLTPLGQARSMTQNNPAGAASKLLIAMSDFQWASTYMAGGAYVAIPDSDYVHDSAADFAESIGFLSSVLGYVRTALIHIANNGENSHGGGCPTCPPPL